MSRKTFFQLLYRVDQRIPFILKRNEKAADVFRNPLQGRWKPDSKN
jgi:hypothetical protein